MVPVAISLFVAFRGYFSAWLFLRGYPWLFSIFAWLLVAILAWLLICRLAARGYFLVLEIFNCEGVYTIVEANEMLRG